MELFGYKQTMSCNGQVLSHSLFNNRSWNRLQLANEKNADSSHEQQRPFVLGNSTIQAIYESRRQEVNGDKIEYEADYGFELSEDEKRDEAT
jgi:hypothetical protein